MSFMRRRWVVLIVLACGTLPASGCSVAEQIIQTIRLALNIADTWV